MKLVNMIGLMDDLDETVSALGQTGVFQPDETAEFFSNNESLLPISAANDLGPVLDKLREMMHSSGIKPQIVDSDEYESMSVEDIDKLVEDFDQSLGAMIRKREELDAACADCKERIETTRHFLGLDIDVERFRECEYIITHFGRLPYDSYEKLSAYSENPYVEFFPCTHDGTYYWGVYVTPIEEAPKVDRIFSRLYFEETVIEDFTGTPKDYIENQQKLIDDMKTESAEIEKEVREYTAAHKDEIIKIFSAICKHHTYQSIKNHACKHGKSFVLVGWIPAEYQGQIEKILKPIKSVEATFTKAEDEIKHSPPVKLRNKFFFKPFEYYTEMYGLPNYRELDPSWFIALTYTVLFGIMFADVGQGIMLLIVAIYMYKKMKMPLGALLIPCSIFSTIFGFIFGSVFGFEELLNPVYKALFNLDEKPIDVLEGQTTMMLIYSAVGIGVVLLMIAMILNIISCIKRKDIGGALFGVNGVAGLTFYASLIIGLVLSMVMNIHIMNTAYILGLIVLPLILIFLREPLSRLIKGEKMFETGIGSFIVDNLFEMFEVALSYVTNTMSFLRVGAFILVHAGMMKVVFVLAGMFSTVGYYITIVVGNIIVMALEALLVGIQVLRLEYYEMFSRFYIGDGRKYEPVTLKDKA